MSPTNRTIPLLALLLLPLAACGEKPPAEVAGWEATIAFQADTKLGGCDVGDLDPRHAGNEIAAVAVDGRVYVVRRGDDGWVTETAATLPGEGIQCAIGDVDPDHAGSEKTIRCLDQPTILKWTNVPVTLTGSCGSGGAYSP